MPKQHINVAHDAFIDQGKIARRRPTVLHCSYLNPFLHLLTHQLFIKKKFNISRVVESRNLFGKVSAQTPLDLRRVCKPQHIGDSVIGRFIEWLMFFHDVHSSRPSVRKMEYTSTIKSLSSTIFVVTVLSRSVRSSSRLRVSIFSGLCFFIIRTKAEF